MARRAILLLLLISVQGWARENGSAWVEVRSPHFTVATDAGDKQARHIADQFERMRWVFKTLFPRSNVDPAAAITVIAVRSQAGFQPLEPEAYLAKGQVKLAGLFLRNTDKNYILLRLDAEEEHPFASVYHEYTHLELGTDGMPLWLNEGLAEFFQNTEIRDKDVLVGEPSTDNILYLRQNRLIPLPVLFQVDANSPYYHEEQKGSVFYAESWALTHYLEFLDYKQHTNHIGTYVGLVNQNEDPVRAAGEAFGDLKQLQSTLEDYIGQGRYMVFHMNSAAAPIDPNTMQVTPLTPPQVDAMRADFLAYSGRSDDAQALLNLVMKVDPNDEPAHETMGFIELRAGHRDDAKKWFGEAAAMNPQSYLALFHLGSLEVEAGDKGDEAEASLRTAIKLNPRFAPAYDALAMLYGTRHENLDEAHMLELQAMSLEPGNVNYRLNVANLLTEQQHFDDAIRVLQSAEKVARTPLEADVVQRVLTQVERNKAQMEQWKQQQAQAEVHTTVVAQSPGGSGTGAAGNLQPATPPRHPTETLHGADRIVEGVIRGAHCNGPGVLELTVVGAKGSVSLYNNDAYKIDFRALNFTPTGEIHPCQDLEGMKARVHYFATADKTVDGQITMIALSK
ncbi:MAG TPA: hypothetical protein VHZ25_09965 [Acidobacteriaceae bacterium]|jgi:tetratricopeptide (TPR) repeat protein|nr:hypothetical protein [Acidobacteriaceae bacterium]